MKEQELNYGEYDEVIKAFWKANIKQDYSNFDFIQHEKDNFFKDCPPQKERFILFVLCWNNGFKYKGLVFEGFRK